MDPRRKRREAFAIFGRGFKKSEKRAGKHRTNILKIFLNDVEYRKIRGSIFMWKIRLREILRWLFKPQIGKWYWLRVAVIAAAALLFFGFFCKPMYLNGGSMEPNYHNGTLNFCWTPAYWFRKPQRGDVVVFRYAGEKILLLKRIVGLPGDIIEFRDGYLYVNGERQEEPYVKLNRVPWNLKPRKVSAGHFYVVGDNRSMPMRQHKFGEIRQSRVEGTLLL